MKPSAKPYTVATISEHQTYKPSKKIIAQSQGNWWNKFHDPQLNQFIKIALSNSPNMQTAIINVKKALAIAQQSKSALFPNINFTGAVTRDYFAKNFIIPPPFAGETASIGLASLHVIQYDLDLWGKKREALCANLNKAQATAADLAETRLVISTAVASTYFSLQYDTAILQIAEQDARDRSKLHKIALANTRHGIRSDIPLTQATAALRTSLITVENAKENIQKDKHQLAILMGKNPFTTQIYLRPFQYNAAVLNLPPIIPANLLGRRPDIVAARWRVEAQAHLINVAKARFFPDINLSALLSYESIGLNRLFDSSNLAKDAVGAIDIPIFDANLRRAALKQQFAEYDEAVEKYNNTILTALQNVADQMSILNAVKSEETSQKSVLNNINKNYALTKSTYEHGIIDYSQLLQLHESLLSQREILIQLQERQILTVVAMIKALGGDYQTTGRNWG